ncbi:DNA repair protein rad18 [Sporormia fimetaria CBS 119925]|uniref:Postreplication repair E3 ubiquitin-protein ligase RAD18 n=1 Tax=Sporormia fimetaria CBS 119925 TaxID=1340428 RepID=A0A6A6VM09_9PLEO|nr:DNA repair protein rad18 [Sporormia fimetaria CBS 119925]
MDTLPDSTDWLTTSLPHFSALEAALRCEVCKEFYQNPVITPCSHTFCSLCVRRCISADGKCPACKKGCQADRLVGNFAVREVVGRFVEGRERALEVARGVGREEGRKRKRSVEGGDDEGVYGEEKAVKRTRSQAGRTRAVEKPIEVLDSEDDEVEEVEELPEGTTRCPICQMVMKPEEVWPHLDKSCKGAQESDRRTTRSRTNPTIQSPFTLNSPRRPSHTTPTPPPQRLPGLNYALLRDTALKKKLQDLGLPSHGRRDQLIKRHTEWLHLWNSNCDASDESRKTKRELLRDLDTWERTQGPGARDSDASVMRKDYDAQAHVETHKGQFADLIAAARKARGAKSTAGNDTTSAQTEDGKEAVEKSHTTQTTQQDSSSRPYEDNERAIDTVRQKVRATNLTGEIQPPSSAPTSSLPNPHTNADREEPVDQGMANPFSSPSRKLPMFALPEEPVVDVEQSAGMP